VDAAASTSIRYRLQRELDWQILEGAKIGAQQAARVSAFAKAAIRRTLHIWYRAFTEVRLAISSGQWIALLCEPGLLASVKRELGRAHVP
jgi:hypothetical protein